jgi:hypothetical protein
MSFIELALNKIVVATWLPGVEMGGNVIKGKSPFQAA